MNITQNKPDDNPTYQMYHDEAELLGMDLTDTDSIPDNDYLEEV